MKNTRAKNPMSESIYMLSCVLCGTSAVHLNFPKIPTLTKINKKSHFKIENKGRHCFQIIKYKIFFSKN